MVTAKKIRPAVKIALVAGAERGLPFCGPGTIKLLAAVKETGSVRDGSALMGISYSKGWKLLSRLEAYAEIKIIERRQGGPGGGGAALTPEGAAFLEHHAEFVAECNREIEKIFKKYYG